MIQFNWSTILFSFYEVFIWDVLYQGIIALHDQVYQICKYVEF